MPPPRDEALRKRMRKNGAAARRGHEEEGAEERRCHERRGPPPREKTLRKRAWKNRGKRASTEAQRSAASGGASCTRDSGNAAVQELVPELVQELG